MKVKLIPLIIISALIILIAFNLNQKQTLYIVVIIHDVVPVNTTEWSLPYVQNNIARLNSLSESYGINYSLAVIPYTLENYELDDDTLETIKKFYIVQHGYRHFNNLTDRKNEAYTWGEFVNPDYGEISLHLQEGWIEQGKNIITSKIGVTPKVFIAPQWEYDDTTLQALSNNNLINFDINKREDIIVDYDPFFPEGITLDKMMLVSLEKAQNTVSQNKVLVMNIHLQFFDDYGSNYMEKLIKNLQEHYEIKFLTLDKLVVSH